MEVTNSGSQKNVIGKVRRDSVHFNLSSLLDTKSISHAEVHVFRRARRGKAPRTKFSFAHHRIRLRNLPKKFLSTIISLLPSRGWQAVDITNTVKTSLGKAKVLSMTVEASIPEFGTGRARYHTVPVDEVLRVAYRPFLVIFSSSVPGSWTSALATTPGTLNLHVEGDSPDDGESTVVTTNQELSTISPLENYPPFRNYAVNFDELENSLKSILNIDKVTPLEQNNQVNQDLAMENNEIGESNSMDHFRLHSPSLPKLLGKIPLINHSHSMGKRSIDDNEFSEDPLTSFSHRHTRTQKDSHENSLNDADDPQFGSNTLLNPRHENEFSLRQDNLDNELTPPSPSSKEANLNPILPYPSRHRWWNQPSDRSWTPSFKTRSRRKGKMNRRKFRRNRKEKKYWPSERTSPPSALPPMATQNTPLSQLSNKEEEEEDSTVKISSCRLEELSVDIANLDWAGRIIAPAILPLNYCEGSCSYLTNSKDLTDSSREDVRNLDFDYLSVDSTTHCCSSYLKKRLVVLFADIHDNIVLRIHPNATTQSCQCV
ncbi:unnamed protein product [Allacma fusca]|uniref:TGF-beta family profile domain-containing protein n=1 Tax=Allacma fusca TaxID=39272 RepID=A0A8J2KZW7_9HEXA|nr:unnamed protein product [Allacma fusca]